MPKSCGKTRYWQEPWSPNQKLQWNMMSSNTDHVKNLHSRGNFGVHTQPVLYPLICSPKADLLFQGNAKAESNSIILWLSGACGHDDKDCDQATCLNIVQNTGPMVLVSLLESWCALGLSCTITWIIYDRMDMWPLKVLHSIIVSQNVDLQNAIPTKEASLRE